MGRRPESLEAAYRAAIYRVLLPDGPLDWRIGAANAAGDGRLRARGCRERWVLLTAVNPRSQPLSAEENRDRQASLENTLQSERQRYLPALHIDPSGRWPDEPSFLLLDPPARLAESLAHHWEQNAIVRGRLGEAPQLVWL